MSRRRDPSDEDEDDDPPDEAEAEDPSDDEVEYFVDPEDDVVRTSVPNSVQSSQSSSSAPSTFAVVSDDCSAPHISHCDIEVGYDRRWEKAVPPGQRSRYAPANRWSAVACPTTASTTSAHPSRVYDPTGRP